ncbi:MAG: zinc-binding dehydrogenase [Deltaproteobacteria bacterium]
MASMSAWVVTSKGAPRDVLELREVPVPEPGPGFLRLAVDAAAIGLPDVLMCRGTYPLTPSGIFTPGQEVVGRVTAVGEGVDPRLLGTRRLGVTAFYLGSGGFAAEALAAEATTFVAPDWLADRDAAGFHIPFLTAWIGLEDRGALARGEHLVVLGAAGGTGAAAVQLGRARGAHVIAVAGGAEKTAFCRAAGADIVIDHRSGDLVAMVRDATGGHGADIIFDPVGGKSATALTAAMANQGRFLLVGFASGAWPQFNPVALVQHNFSVVGVFAGAYDQAHAEAAYGVMLPMLQDGSLASIVTREIPFTDLPEALESLADRSAIGKCIVKRQP